MCSRERADFVSLYWCALRLFLSFSFFSIVSLLPRCSIGYRKIEVEEAQKGTASHRFLLEYLEHDCLWIVSDRYAEECSSSRCDSKQWRHCYWQRRQLIIAAPNRWPGNCLQTLKWSTFWSHGKLGVNGWTFFYSDVVVRCCTITNPSVFKRHTFLCLVMFR